MSDHPARPDPPARNGINLRATMTVTGILGAGALIFTLGANWKTMTGHIEAKEIHENTQEKQLMIDRRVELLLGPELRAINRRLKAIENKME